MAPISLTRTGPDEGGEFEYPWSGDYLHVHLLSHIGKKRSDNEDSSVICAPEDAELARERGLLVAVADGMGGVSGGAFASRLALQSLVESYYLGNKTSTPARMRQGVLDANRSIYEAADNRHEYFGMGTTVSAVVVMGEYAYIAHVGDSRVYLFRDRSNLLQVTHDHSLVAEQVRSGVLSEEQARTHSLRNLITRAVGTKQSVKVDVLAVHLEDEDRLMICSDGLSNVVSDARIAEAMAIDNTQGVARSLVGQALEGGGPDNITVAVLGFHAPLPKTRLEAGAVEVSFTRPGLLGRFFRLFTG